MKRAKDATARARRVRLIVLDVDGVLTDGRMVLTERGDELKFFHTHDGMAVNLARRSGLAVALVTGEKSTIAQARGVKLGIEDIVLGARRKGDTLARFQREARAAAKLQHPNIVTIYDFGEDGETLFIAMELLEGQDLAHAMAVPRRLTRDQKLKIVVQACRGLDYAHKQGVYHRDVKPANVHVRPDLTVKIVDFGIARLADSNMTQTGLVLGTPSYIAPEALTAPELVDGRTDLYGLGAVAHFLLCGAPPFAGKTIVEVCAQHMLSPPTPLRTLVGNAVSVELERLVLGCLAKDPAGRPANARELIRRLRRCPELEMPPAHGGSPARRARPVHPHEEQLP